MLSCEAMFLRVDHTYTLRRACTWLLLIFPPNFQTQIISKTHLKNKNQRDLKIKTFKTGTPAE